MDWMDPDQSSEKENAAFQQAMILAGGEFLEVKNFLSSSHISTIFFCLVAANILDVFFGQKQTLPHDNIFFLYICQSVRFHARSWLPARSIVIECLESRKNIDPSGEIMVLNIFCPVSMPSYFISDI